MTAAIRTTLMWIMWIRLVIGMTVVWITFVNGSTVMRLASAKFFFPQTIASKVQINHLKVRASLVFALLSCRVLATGQHKTKTQV